MAQRLGIAAALLGDPSVLLLDEPVNGLDPDGIVWIRGFLRSLAAEGRTVFVSSHLMGELEGTADHLIVIGRGRLLADTAVDDLLARMSDGTVRLRTPDGSAVMAVLANAGGTVTSTGDGAITVTGIDAGRVGQLVAEHGLRLSELTQGRATLEEAYLRLTRGSTEFGADA
jgi:ABC-2 type transport system ATP-binding protein